jgi:hypothetical protein
MIELVCKRVDAEYWGVLKSFQVHHEGPKTLSPTKTPALLLNRLEMYAGALFRAEGDQYPKAGADYGLWLSFLSGRIVARIMQTVDEVEATSAKAKLSYHGLDGEKARERLTALLADAVDRYVWLAENPRPPTPEPQPSAVDEPTADESIAVAGTEVSRREALLAEYKTATNGVSNKRIYEARNSGVHKPEFYGWLRGDLPTHATPTLNLERFLRAKKLPIPRKLKS